MGLILTGYGEDAYDHEGYAAQVLDDGSITSTHSNETRPRMIGQVVAACGCGWAGTTRYPCPEPFDEQAEGLALAEWETSHARPVLEGHHAERWARLQRLVHAIQARLVEHHPGAGSGAELLQCTVRDLTAATDLARQLRRCEPDRGESR